MSPRRPYPKQRDPRKTVFTPELWQLWWVERRPDANVRRLRRGIADLRRRLREVRP